MNIIQRCIQRPVTICMITIGVLAFGTISLMKLPLNLLPELSYPTLTLETRYAGAAPEEVEYLITRPIEEAVSVIPNIKRVTSSSKPELSQVTLEFDWGRNMDFAILDVSKKLDMIRLPEDVEKPRILRFDPNQEPILKMALTADMPLTDLRYFAEEDLKKRLDGVPGLASVKVIGGREQVVQVHLDEAALKRYGLSIETVSTRLREENINRAGGSLYENEARYLVRTMNEFETLADIGQTIIARVEDRRVYLSEVADIQYGHKDQTLISRIDAQEGVELAFYKEGDANTVQVSKTLRSALNDARDTFGDTFGMTITYESATFIEKAVDEVKSNAALGGLIAIIVLLIFLRDFKGTIIVGFAIPVSVFATFFLMLQFGVSMNIMSLGGLALGIGMLVDNSIVVLESIIVHRNTGKTPLQAASDGAREVSGAVLAATLTTVVVFLPMVFVKGIGGQLFRDLGMTVSFSLMASLVVSLTLMPTLYALFSRAHRKAEQQAMDKAAGQQTASPNEVVATSKAGHVYAWLITQALRFRWAVLALAVVLIVQSGQLYRMLGLNLVPEMSQGDYFILVEHDEGTPIELTDRLAQSLEQQLTQVDGIRVVFSTVGEFNQGVESRSGENLAQINFALDTAVKAPENVLSDVREIIASGPPADYQLGSPSYFSFSTPVEVIVFDEARKNLVAASEQLVTAMRESTMFRDVQTTVADGNPEVRIAFNREMMSKMDLSIGSIAGMLRDKIQGTEASRFVQAGRDIDIVVRLAEEDRQALAQLDQMTVAYKDGRPVYLRSIADIDIQLGPAQIKRIAKQRAAVISANLAGEDLEAAKLALMPMIDRVQAQLPDVSIHIGGQTEEMEEAFGSLRFVILLAVFLVYLVMASQFESLTHPLLILFTVPIGMVGGLAALYVTGLELSVIALIGLVMLAGIVVNNAIVLIDYINQLRREDYGLYEAIVLAGQRRLRPIFMTTTTTVLGLVPMALGLGSGAEMRMPLAVTVIGGLIFSTVLTLIIIPVLYGTFTRGLKLPAKRNAFTKGEVTA